ncbi:hypothetical protein FQA47_010590 [Oryzias melastigma]|uniref:Uncharacterized protein n=1 Tax=Oryzias melastigma TaxID=30732 RepID=A0A834FIB1_ORYME|nr:hypothetical protein FQA47_010590 [Oryzias melastigma]
MNQQPHKCPGSFTWGPVAPPSFRLLSQNSRSLMRLEAAARMDLFRKLWRARKLILVVLIPLSLLPLPLIHPTSVSPEPPHPPPGFTDDHLVCACACDSKA